MWPLRRKAAPGSEHSPRPAPASAAERGGTSAAQAEWATLSPLGPEVSKVQPVAEYETFKRSLSSWRRPDLSVEPLGHEVSLEAPPGIVTGLVTRTVQRTDGPPLVLHAVPHPQSGST